MITKAACLILALALTPFVAAQAAEGVLRVRGEIKTPLSLTVAEIKSRPSATAHAKDHSGKIAAYEGVSLSAILQQAGVPLGEALRGDALQLCVVVRAADGYKAVFALAELDPAMTDKQVILAFRKDDADLDPATGPLRLVIPDEKQQARWVRQVTELEVVRVGAGEKPLPNVTK
jgi:DMSO/TMAO reductase YedYZ molybdopterin-dependent catalytic subunit